MSKEGRPGALPLDPAKGQAFGNHYLVEPVQGGSPWRVQGSALALLRP